jgi:phenylalanyl-tRNA synthetase beta chain
VSIAGDKVLEVEVTANRPDWLSYIGVAREVAAITGRKLKIPPVKNTRAPHGSGPGIKVSVEDRKLCPRYTARVIKNVKVGESPAWLKARLEAMGLRPVNNIVDITNFCLFETGEPMHAFDLDKLSGQNLTIRCAKKGEKIKSIDGAERPLESSMIVIADCKGPVAIAGIMGGAGTEVNYSTRNILLEAAEFDPVSIRRASRKLALSTDSSYRFERRVDPSNVKYASDRATALICEIAGGSAVELIDIGGKTVKIKPVTLRAAKLSSVLGIDMPQKTVKNILVGLGLKQKSSAKSKTVFEIPGFRHDLKEEIDLIEEVARIYGYNKIPDTIPAAILQPERLSSDMAALKKMRAMLTGMGLSEIITYSLLSKKAIQNSAMMPDDAVCVANPLSAEQEAMRPSLIPGMLGVVLRNINRKSKDLRLFEIGRLYSKADHGFTEKQFLGVCITGEISSWAAPTRACSFFDLKGIVEELFRGLGIRSVLFVEAADCRFSGDECASIELNNESVGMIGRVDGKVLADFDIKSSVYACEICLDKIFKYAETDVRFEALPKYPSVLRDISIIAESGTKNRAIEAVISASAGAILKTIKLVDRYSGKQIPDGKISLTYRLEYQDPSRTLEEKDVLDAQNKILSSLNSQLGAKLR